MRTAFGTPRFRVFLLLTALLATAASPQSLRQGEAVSWDETSAEARLSEAAKRCDADAVTELIEEGADVNALVGGDRWGGDPLEGRTPLMIVADVGPPAARAEFCLDVIDLLLQHDADVNITTKRGETALWMLGGYCTDYTVAAMRRFIKAGALVEQVRIDSGENPIAPERRMFDTVLGYFSQFACPDAVDVILRHVDDVDTRFGMYGYTSLLAASAYRFDRKDYAARVVAQLIRAGADVNARATIRDRSSALELATGSGNAGAVRALLRAGASPARYDANTAPAICIAAVAGPAAVMQALVDADVPLNIECWDKKTPLDVYVENFTYKPNDPDFRETGNILKRAPSLTYAQWKAGMTPVRAGQKTATNNQPAPQPAAPTQPSPVASYYVVSRYHCIANDGSSSGSCDVTTRGTSCQEARSAQAREVQSRGGDPCKQCLAGVTDNTRRYSGVTEELQLGPCR